MSLAIVLKYLHILAAMIFVAGLIGTALSGIRAGHAPDPATRLFLIRQSNFFASKLLVPFALIAGALGFITALVTGYDVLSGWVLYAEIVYLTALGIGIFILDPHGKALERAAVAGDVPTLRRLATAPLPRALNAVTIVLVLFLIYLMVFKPA